MVPLFLIACEASRLGVVLPEGGADAISQEDLQRDVSALQREDARLVLERRLAQVHVARVISDDGRVCGVVHGGAAPVLVVRADWPESLATRVQAAALVSLAKGLDGAVPPQTTWLCAARTGLDLRVLGAEGARAPSATPPPVLPTPPRHATAAGLASQPNATTYEQVDWRVVETDVRRQFIADIDIDGQISARAAAHAAAEKLKRSRGPGTSARPSPP